MPRLYHLMMLEDFNIVTPSECLAFMNSRNTGHIHDASIDVQRCYFILNNHGEWRWNKDGKAETDIQI